MKFIYEKMVKENVKIHRLVADAFISNDDPINKITINHIDGNRANNKVDNLEWASYSENEKHSYDELNRPINIPKKPKRQTIAINKIENTKIIYNSIEAASRGTGVSGTQIRRIAAGECNNKIYNFIIEEID